MSSRLGWDDLVWDDPDGGRIVLHEYYPHGSIPAQTTPGD